jgi:shikimate dehydrogenase
MIDPTPSPSAMVGIGKGRVLAGLLGRGILESRTPFMHECEAQAQGLRMVYSLLDFSDRGWADDDLARVLDSVQMVGFAGVNVTFPFKQAVLPLLDELSPQAAAIGAVNTIAFRDGKRLGYNTDVTGFGHAFADRMAGAPMDSVLQLGCGGAGSATAHALLGVIGVGHLAITDTDPARAQALHDQLAAAYGAARVSVAEDAVQAAAQADGIVNATPIGMAKFPGMPIGAEALQPRHWVSEIIYFPLETALLQSARALGCRTMTGRGMAVGQAVDAFAIFTGLTPDRQRMWDSFARFAEAQQG